MENNIKIYVQEVGWGMDWNDLTQDRDRFEAFLNAEINVRVL
jgi:hypothetical protein